MSMVPLSKVTFYGPKEEKEEVLSDLQTLGCLHLIPLNPEAEEHRRKGASSRSREALRFLSTCPLQRRQVRDPSRFDASRVERRALELKDRIQDLEDERDFLRDRLTRLRPWGTFAFPPPEQFDHLRLWFYAVPNKEMNKVAATDLVWEAVSQDSRFSYVVVLSRKEPEGMPVPRVRTGNRSPSDLEARLEAVEVEIEDLQAERSSLTRWCTLFSDAVDRLEDQAAVRDAALETYDGGPLFALQAWAPEDQAARLERYAIEKGLAFVKTDPEPGDTPPTLMENPLPLSSGQSLVQFYLTPKYGLWDPSVVVFFSFAVFFAMILADAGYSAVLGLVLAALWKRLGRSDLLRPFRVLTAVLAGTGLIYGVLVGSYFGTAPAPSSLLEEFRILSMTDFRTMMMLSVGLGVFHLVLANAVTAWHRRRSFQALAPASWVLILMGGLSIYVGASGDGAPAFLRVPGAAALGLGLAAVLLFSASEGSIGRRLLRGLQGLTRLSNAFGDSLSYLRLFALGLASASLAGTFNDLAAQVRAAVPGIGLLFGLVIVVLGHAMNFVLAVSSGVIHGLRLNFIEFFGWSVPEEGYPFRAFARKEKRSWTQ